MRRTAVEIGAMAALLLGGALAYGQSAAPPVKVEDKPKEAKVEDKAKEAPAKSKLEEMLQQALQNNPDLRLAAAKVAEAEAELNRARLQVVRKVSAAYQAVETQKAAVEMATARLDEVKKAELTPGEYIRVKGLAQQKLIDAKVKLAELEAEMPYLIGKQPANYTAYPTIPAGAIHYAEFPVLGRTNQGTGALHLTNRLHDPNAGADGSDLAPIVGPTADRIRAALDKPFEFECDGKSVPVRTILREMSMTFQENNPNSVIKYNIPEADKTSISVNFYAMPIGAALEYIEDALPEYRVVVRDYGILIAPKDQLPPGAPLLRDFWKSAKGEEKTPTNHVEGVVKTVNAAGMVAISIGTDAGIAMGDTLDVYRLDAKTPEQSKYLGRIKIIEATPKKAIGQPIGKMTGPVKVGDQVSSRIVGD